VTHIAAHFADELRAAGLTGLPFSWGDDGSFHFDPRITPEQRLAIETVYAAHDPDAVPVKPDPQADAETKLGDLKDTDVVTGADLRAILAGLGLHPRSR
jgi:hypothetical protein